MYMHMCNELYCFVSKTEQIPIFTTTLNFNIAFLDIFYYFHNIRVLNAGTHKYLFKLLSSIAASY